MYHTPKTDAPVHCGRFVQRHFVSWYQHHWPCCMHAHCQSNVANVATTAVLNTPSATNAAGRPLHASSIGHSGFNAYCPIVSAVLLCAHVRNCKQVTACPRRTSFIVCYRTRLARVCPCVRATCPIVSVNLAERRVRKRTSAHPGATSAPRKAGGMCVQYQCVSFCADAMFCARAAARTQEVHTLPKECTTVSTAGSSTSSRHRRATRVPRPSIDTTSILFQFSCLPPVYARLIKTLFVCCCQRLHMRSW
jgi:hypothetical protein